MTPTLFHLHVQTTSGTRLLLDMNTDCLVVLELVNHPVVVSLLSLLLTGIPTSQITYVSFVQVSFVK